MEREIKMDGIKGAGKRQDSSVEHFSQQWSRALLAWLSLAMVCAGMWPVLQRELREQARQGGTYWLRVVAAGVFLLLFWLAWEGQRPGRIPSGRGYFFGLQRLLFLTIWFVGPVLTADCLSREKREGTLGLLFLTPLRAVDVVVGKVFVFGLRGLVFVAAVVPILIVPALLGGVGWLDALRMLFLQFGALGLALVSGLVASAFAVSWWWTRILAFLCACLGAAVFTGLLLLSQALPTALQRSSGSWTARLARAMSEASQGWVLKQEFLLNRGFRGLWMDWGHVGANWKTVGLASAVGLASWALVIAAIVLAAYSVRRSWRVAPMVSNPNSSRGWRRVVLGRLAVRSSRGSAKRSANPVGWLQGRSPFLGIVRAVLLGFALAIAALVFTTPYQSAYGWIFLGRVGLLGAMAFAAAASFREERESGALELLLVTPVTPTEMIRSRVVWLGMQFVLPTLVIFFLPAVLEWWLNLRLAALNSGAGFRFVAEGLWDMGFLLWVGGTLVLGVAVSLSRLSFLTAFLLTWVAHHTAAVVGAFIDWANRQAASHWGFSLPDWNPGSFSARLNLVLAVAVMIWGFRFACRQLAERRYADPGLSAGLSSVPKPLEAPSA